jgi:hypothetical protein
MGPNWGSMSVTTTELLRRAEHYRDIAAHVTDEQTHTGLLELADKYEVLAREVQADDPLQSL